MKEAIYIVSFFILPLSCGAAAMQVNVLQVSTQNADELARFELFNSKRGCYGNTSLHYACALGHVPIIQNLLEHNADVNLSNSEGDSPLHRAVENCRVKAAQELLKIRRLKVNIQNNNGDTPLHRAASHGILELVQSLLAQGADVNLRNSDGDSPLNRAVENHNIDVVYELLKVVGVNVNVVNKCGDTPLLRATAYPYGKNQMIVRALIKRGADVNATDGYGCCPLVKAVETKNSEIVHELLRAPHINGNIQNHHGDTALHIASSSGATSIVEGLRLFGAHVNIRNNDRDCPLNRAVESQHVSVVKELLKCADIEINVYNKYGDTPLHRACYNGNIEITKLLLEHGALINLRNLDMRTPIAHACHEKHEDVANELLKAPDIDVNCADRYDWTPMHDVAAFGSASLIRAFIALGARVDKKNKAGDAPLHKISLNKDEQAIREMLNASGDFLNIVDGEGRTLLHLAAKLGNDILTKALLSREVAINECDRYNYTPLHEALAQRNEIIANELLGFENIDVNIHDNLGSTPLLTAIECGLQNVAQRLVKNDKTKINLSDQKGDTPLMIGVCCCRASDRALDLIKALLSRKDIDINAQNYAGLTALHYAVISNEKREIIVRDLLAVPAIDITKKDVNGQTALMFAEQVLPEDAFKGLKEIFKRRDQLICIRNGVLAFLGACYKRTGLHSTASCLLPSIVRDINQVLKDDIEDERLAS